MSGVFICEKCGKKYENRGEKYENGVKLLSIEGERYEFNLCKDCHKELSKYLEETFLTENDGRNLLPLEK